MTVENLEIKVSAKGVTAAANRLNSLADAIDRVESVSGKVTGGTTASAQSVKAVGNAAQKANKPLGNFVNSLKRIAFYRMIRGIIKSITQAFGEGLEWAYNFSKGLRDADDSSGRFAAAMDRMATKSSMLKAQLGSAFIGLLAVIEPVLTRIINLITAVADAISQIFAAFTGTSYIKAADGLANAFERGAGAAKEWKNQLLGFDEINRLNEPSGGGGGSLPLSGIQGKDAPLDDWAMKIHDNLAAIEMAAAGFALAVGLILALSGVNIPLGLSLIAIGAFGMAQAASENWDTVSQKIGGAVAKVMMILGGALLAIGAILLFATPSFSWLGLGLMAAGAASLAAGAAINWNIMPNEIKKVVGEILLVLGGALLVVGAVLAFSNISVPLGIALMAAGAATLASGLALNWNGITQKVKEVLSQIMAILGLSLAGVGIMLCLTGGGLPLGLALIAAGLASSYSAYFINANPITTAVKQVLDDCWLMVSGFFLGIWEWIVETAKGIAGLFSKAWNASGPEYDPYQNGDLWLEGFASGGFPVEGQLFVAQEDGPEMVGTIGGRNAVATNNDIVEAIRQGVYDAVVAGNINNGGDVSVKVYLDSREIKSGQQRLNRAMGA